MQKVFLIDFLFVYRFDRIVLEAIVNFVGWQHSSSSSLPPPPRPSPTLKSLWVLLTRTRELLNNRTHFIVCSYLQTLDSRQIEYKFHAMQMPPKSIGCCCLSGRQSNAIFLPFLAHGTVWLCQQALFMMVWRRCRCQKHVQLTYGRRCTYNATHGAGPQQIDKSNEMYSIVCFVELVEYGPFDRCEPEILSITRE